MTPQPQHCDHECMCRDYPLSYRSEIGRPCSFPKCPHDTRSRPAPSHSECYKTGYAEGAAQAREDTIEKLDVIRKHAQEQYKEAECSDDLDLMAMHLDYENQIWDIMKSLRSTEAHK